MFLKFVIRIVLRLGRCMRCDKKTYNDKVKQQVLSIKLAILHREICFTACVSLNQEMVAVNINSREGGSHIIHVLSWI